MRSLLQIWIVSATLLCGTHAFAQVTGPLPPEPDRVTVTPFLGAGFGGDLESAPFTFGAALGYGLTSRWSVEGDLYFQPDATEGQLVEFDTTLWALSANVLYHFTGKNVTPYVAAGLGAVTAHADLDAVGLIDDETSTKLSWNWGGGVMSAASRRFGLRADMRYFTGDELVPDHWRVYGGVVIRSMR